MSSSTKPQRVSYVEDANEETGDVIEGTERYAVSEAEPSPSKEKPNISRSRRDMPTGRSTSSSPHNGLTDSDSTVHPTASSKKDKEARLREKEKAKAREKERAREQRAREKDMFRDREADRERVKSTKKVTIERRPETRHSQTTPVLHAYTGPQETYRRPTNVAEDATHFGINPESRRPRTNSRPQSYYGYGSKPPMANERWHAQQTQGSAYMSSAYPPPSSYGHSAATGYPTASPVVPTPTDYFNPASASPQQSHLASRFQLQRPSSAHGFRQTPTAPAYQYDSYAPYEQENDATLIRRPSIKKQDEDRRRMPPPPRPLTTGPKQESAFRAPMQQPPSPRRTTTYSYADEDLEDGDGSMYHEIVPSRSTSYSYGERAVPSRHRRGSVTYDAGPYSIEPAATGGRRRHSYYGTTAGTDSEAKMRAATAYQQGLEGGPTMPLTAETLRRAAKRGSDKSSRSTRSSESRDESEYRQSNTTRTTRSSAGDEDITIKVTGSATLKLGGAEIQCQDGGEISITQQGGAIRTGSDRGTSIYGDDRPHRRLEQLPFRSRATSQAPSYSRSPFASAYEGYPGRPF